jgi:hypothetical protein
MSSELLVKTVLRTAEFKDFPAVFLKEKLQLTSCVGY